MLRALVVMLLLLVPAASAAEAVPGTLEDAISMLDRELGRSEQYIKAREASLDSIKALLAGASGRDSLRLLDEIARGYDAFRVDSTVIYFYKAMEKARELGDSVAAQRMAFNRYGRLPLLGVARESVDGFQRIRWEVYPQNRTEFFDVGNRMLLYTADLYPRSPIRDTYVLASVQLADSLMTRLDVDDPLYLLMAAQRASHDKDYTTLVASLNDIIDNPRRE